MQGAASAAIVVHCRRGQPSRHGQRHPRARHGRGGEGQFRPSRHAHGHGRRGDRAVRPVPEVRCRAHPHWPDRDRFVLSAGHGSMLLYALLYLTGYPDMTLDEHQALPPARQPHRRSSGIRPRARHRDDDRPAGPGPRQFRRHGAWPSASWTRGSATTLVDHRTYVIAGDGCLMEGISHEAISLAGHLKLNKLIVLFDDNQHLDRRADLARRLRRSARALPRRRLGAPSASTARIPRPSPRRSMRAQSSDRPSLIACRTTIGYGAPKKAGTAATHGSPLGAEEIAGARAKLGWSYPPFVVPDAILAAWRAVGQRGKPQLRRLAEAARRARRARRVRAPHRRRSAGRGRCRHRRSEEERIGRGAEDGDAAVLAEGARGARADAARARRRLGRSHRLEQHQGQGHGAGRRRRTTAAATSTTACASTAWPRR